MKKATIKPQIEQLSTVNTHLKKLILALEDAKDASLSPDFFEYLTPGNTVMLEQQNSRLQTTIKKYENTLNQIEQSVTQMINTLETLIKQPNP